MSKTEQEGPKTLKDDLLEKERENIRLRAELEEAKASNKRLSTQNSKLKTKGGGTESRQEESSATEHSATEHSHAQEEPKAPEEPKGSPGGLPPAPGVSITNQPEGVHLVKSWSPRYCPDCGTKNPEFKDEVQCHSCKVGLGAKDKVTSGEFKVCPNCGKGRDNGGGWEYVPGIKVV